MQSDPYGNSKYFAERMAKVERDWDRSERRRLVDRALGYGFLLGAGCGATAMWLIMVVR